MAEEKAGKVLVQEVEKEGGESRRRWFCQ